MRRAIFGIAGAAALLGSMAFCAVVRAKPGSAAATGTKATAKHSVYGELLGPAVIYSLNYEYHLGYWAGRIGAEYLSLDAAADESAGEVGGKAPFVAIPLSVAYLGLGSGSHLLELGAGVTLAYVGARATVPFIDSRESASEAATTMWVFVPSGYRFQPPGMGFLFRAGLTPIVGGGGFKILPHIALGASF